MTGALAAQTLVPAEHSLMPHAAGPLLRAPGVSQGDPDDHMGRSVQQSEMHWVPAAGSQEGRMCLLERAVDYAAECADDCAAEGAAEQRRGAGLGCAGWDLLGRGCFDLEATHPVPAAQQAGG